MNRSLLKKFVAGALLTLILGGVVFFAVPVFAKPYTLSVPFGRVTQVSGPAEYIRNLYDFLIYAGAILAIAMVVYGGIRYTVSEVIPSKQDALDIIRNALLGLALLLAAFLIVHLINAKLPGSPGELKEPDAPTVTAPLPDTSSSTSENPCGNGKIDAGEECDFSAPGGQSCRIGEVCGNDCRCQPPS